MPYRWDPETFGDVMAKDVPDYDELQDRVAVAAGERPAGSILDLGTGTGETARRVLARQPGATLVGVDSSPEMLEEARRRLPSERADLVVSRLEDPLPEGPFDLVVSALAVHHLDAAAKRDLFRRVAAVLASPGRLVLGDVVVPGDPAEPAHPPADAYDKPDRVVDQVRWLEEAGFDVSVAWRHGDLALVVADRR